jgi:hypothetical protein
MRDRNPEKGENPLKNFQKFHLSLHSCSSS